MTKSLVSVMLMRPVKNDDQFTIAMQLLIDYMCDEDHRLDEIVPEGRNFIPVTVAADGSAAEFDVFVDDSSPEPKGDPVGRILVRRESGPAIAS